MKRYVAAFLGLLGLIAVFALGYVNEFRVSAEGSVPETAQKNKLPNLNGEAAEEYLKEQGLYKSLGEAMAAARYSIYEVSNHPVIEEKGKVAEANNPKHQFSAYFSWQGTTIVPKTGKADWDLKANFTGYGRGEDIKGVERLGEKVLKGRKRIEIGYRAKDGKAAPTEWFINGAEGLEQGWTVAERPNGERGALTIELGTDGSLKPKAAKDGGSVTFSDGKGRAVIRYERLKSWDAEGKELETRIETRGQKLRITVDDAKATYPVTVDPYFTQAQKLTASDASADDNFGFSVSVSGDTAVVGANFGDFGLSFTGSAYVFTRNEGGADSWGEVRKLTASDAEEFDNFGQSVSVSGDTVVVGAPNNDDDGTSSGSAYVFTRNEGGADNWGEVKKLTASDAVEFDSFGLSVSVSGDAVVVGAWVDDAGTDSGSAYVFTRNEGGIDNWGEVKKLTASDAAAGDYFGISVSIDGDTVMVGAFQDDDGGENSGSAYVYNRNQGGADNWGEAQKLTASDAAAGDEFGGRVSVSGDTVVVGTRFDDDDGADSGSAYVFTRNEGGADNWGEVKKLTASDADATDQFGYSVSVSGDTVVVGASRNIDSGIFGGSAYVFTRNEGGADNWGEVLRLNASDAADSDFFGAAVSVDGDTILVGATFDDDGGMNSGSAYVFRDQEGVWSQVSKRFSSDPAAFDFFGGSVSVSGDTVIVGARGEDEGGDNSGSAYVFARNQGVADGWGEVKKLTASDALAADLFGSSVSVSGDTVVVGANGNSGARSGSAYVFTRNAGGADNWGEVQKLTASDAAVNDFFGFSVSVSGDTIVVGARNAGGAGSAYIFTRNQGGVADSWGETKKITASDAAVSDFFGWSVSVTGDTVVVGAIGDDDGGNESGSAYLFTRNQGGADNWGEVKKLTASDAAADNQFGTAVSVTGDLVVVGSPKDDEGGSNSGSAYIFARNQGGADNWGEVTKLTAPDPASIAQFGWSVSVDGDTVAIGANQDDDFGFTSGSAYVFTRNLGGADTWGLSAKLTASDAAASDTFGSSVSVSGDTVIIGSPLGDNAPLLRSVEERQIEKKEAGSLKQDIGAIEGGAAYIYNVGFAPTTTTTVSGRVTNGTYGLFGVVVTITDAEGGVRSTRTNNFGYFRFTGVETGQALLVNTYSKSYSFTAQVVNVNGDLTGLEIIGSPVSSFRQLKR